MRHFENPLLGLEACIDDFDKACLDYETVLATKERMGAPRAGKFTNNMACAVLNPIGMKYGVLRARIGVEDLSLPRFGNEGITDILKAIGEAILNAIKRFFNWIGSLFGVGGSSGGGGSGGGSGGGGGGGGARKAAREAKEAVVEKAVKTSENKKPKKSKSSMTAEEISEYLKKSDAVQERINNKVSTAEHLGTKIDSKKLADSVRENIESAAFLLAFSKNYTSDLITGINRVLGKLKGVADGTEEVKQEVIDDYVEHKSHLSKDMVKKMKGIIGVVKDPDILDSISRHDGETDETAILYRGLNASIAAAYVQRTYENKLLEVYFYFGNMKNDKKTEFDFKKDINLKNYASLWNELKKASEELEISVKKSIASTKPPLEEIQNFIEEYLKKADENTSSIEIFRLYRRTVSSSFALCAGLEQFQSYVHHGLMEHGDLIRLLAEYDDVSVIEI